MDLQLVLDEAFEMSEFFNRGRPPTLTQMVRYIATVYNEKYGVTSELEDESYDLADDLKHEMHIKFRVQIQRSPMDIGEEIADLVQTFAQNDRDAARHTLQGHRNLGRGQHPALVGRISSYLGRRR